MDLETIKTLFIFMIPFFIIIAIVYGKCKEVENFNMIMCLSIWLSIGYVELLNIIFK